MERVLEENAASEAGRDNEDVDVGSEPRLRPLLRPLAEEEEAYQSDPYQAENGETSFTPADERRPTDEIFDDRNFDARAALTAITKAISDLKMERPGVSIHYVLNVPYYAYYYTYYYAYYYTYYYAYRIV